MYKASVKVYCTAYFKCFNYQVFSCESPEGTLASEAQLDKTKMCENQKYLNPVVHSSVPSPVVQSTDYTFQLLQNIYFDITLH